MLSPPEPGPQIPGPRLRSSQSSLGARDTPSSTPLQHRGSWLATPHLLSCRRRGPRGRDRLPLLLAAGLGPLSVVQRTPVQPRRSGLACGKRRKTAKNETHTKPSWHLTTPRLRGGWSRPLPSSFDNNAAAPASSAHHSRSRRPTRALPQRVTLPHRVAGPVFVPDAAGTRWFCCPSTLHRHCRHNSHRRLADAALFLRADTWCWRCICNKCCPSGHNGGAASREDCTSCWRGPRM